MNCVQTEELLSAYYDNELPHEERMRVAEHLKVCTACSVQLTGFTSLSALADRLTSPSPPEHGWRRLEESLDDDSAAHVPDRRPPRNLSSRRMLTVAAALLVMFGIGWAGHRIWSPQHRHVAAFGHYLEQFSHDPEKAQQMLLAKYQGVALETESVVQKVGYRPAVADGLPEGYSIESSFVMDMPCCTCVQTLCRRRDGSVLVIFEHDDERPEWFGSRPGIMANCGGKQCSLVELESQLAVSWKRGPRHMTIIGARDVGEVDKMVSWLDGNI